MTVAVRDAFVVLAVVAPWRRPRERHAVTAGSTDMRASDDDISCVIERSLNVGCARAWVDWKSEKDDLEDKLYPTCGGTCFKFM